MSTPASESLATSTDLTKPGSSTPEDGPRYRQGYEDVAIIGMSCRTAGGNDTPEKLWQFLLDMKNASGELPQWRWEPWRRRDARNAKELEKTLSKAYFVENVEDFDASFFGISPKEAEQMDPHQRLGLELTWEALENAGVDPRSLSGSDSAVFMGIDSDDYSRLLLEDIPNIDAHMGIGTSYHGVPNRISYHLDLMGPSAAVDAACASSGVAIHLGRQAILNGESKVAIVGGVNVLLGPALTRMLGKAGALSPEGVCRSFSDDANGYARGEGGAVIILKRLADALADGDNILATIKGSAIAQDGKTNGIMAPNAKAQELVARQALARAAIDPLTVEYIEAHATSTPLGDPTEISAIAAVYGAGRSKDAPALIGSIKPNVGHLEAAAGAIGMVKAVMAVNKGQIAPQTLLGKLNSRVHWDQSGLEVVREPAKWVNEDGLRRAAVCTYGYGGTVAHAVIEEFMGPIALREPQNGGNSEALNPESVMLTVSGFQEKRLPEHLQSLAKWMSSPEGQQQDLSAIANTLAQRRAHHDYRVAVVASSHSEAAQALRNIASGKPTDAYNAAQSRVLPSSRMVWVFSGHGAQWTDMGKTLMRNYTFRQSIEELDPIYQEEAGFSLVQSLENGDFDTSERVQVLTYAVQIALSQVLRSKGLEPQAVIGHSVGEIAAAVVAGCLTIIEGALVVIRRAKLYAKVRAEGLGGMALVNQSFAQVKAELGEEQKDLVAAIDPSPTTCVISGEEMAVADYVERLKARGVKTYRVKTDVAFHSPCLEKLETPLREALNGLIHPQPATIPIYSTSQDDARTKDLRHTEYWVENMVRPVRLRSAVRTAVDDGYRIFVEVSSHPIVLQSIDETLVAKDLDESEFTTIATMKRDVSPDQTISNALAQLYVKGAPINFETQLGHKRWWSKTVPTAPWVHKPFWKQVETGPLGDGAAHETDRHTLKGRKSTVAGTDLVLFTTKLDDKTKPFPGTHPLDGTEIIPAGVYINTFHDATGATEFSDIQLRVPVSMSADVRSIQITVQGNLINVASQLDATGQEIEQSWIQHCSAEWSFAHEELSQVDLSAIQNRIGTVLPNSFAWEYLQKIGVEGIAFPWQVVEHFGNAKKMLAKVDMNPDAETLDWDPHSWAPLLDAATSVGSTIFYFFNDPKLRIVSGMDRVTLHSRDPLPKVAYLHVEEAADSKGLAAHISVISESGKVLAKIHSMRFSEVEGAAGVSGSVDSLVHHVNWIPAQFLEAPRAFDRVVLISSDAECRETYAKQLQSHTKELYQFKSSKELQSNIWSKLNQKGSAIVFVPGIVESMEQVAPSAKDFAWETVELIKMLSTKSSEGACKLYVITSRVYAGDSLTGLAQGPLYGLARIIASEHPDLWGGLIDVDETWAFPLMAVKYVREPDVIRMIDGLPRRAMMRPLSKDQRHSPQSTTSLMPKPEGTYVITGGLGGLGLETASFLVEKGARRIVLVSRRGLPPRRKWPSLCATNEKLSATVEHIRKLERQGASIHAIALDVSASEAFHKLSDELDRLSLPPVLGVVHAAGVLEDSVLLETKHESFDRVMAPKVNGALALHNAFPPGSGLDFFVLYSSIGQLVGTVGQTSYASANAFLDALATHRRANGDNAVSFQFTAWRDLGMATDIAFVEVELESKGITDVTRDEAFRAWEHVSAHNVGSAVVTRCRAIDEGDIVPVPMMEQVVVRRAKAATATAASQDGTSNGTPSLDVRPTSSTELEKWLNVKIRECIATVLMMSDIDDIDARAQLADLGVDSVMTVALRQKMQTILKVKVPPTLTWNHPTVNHLVAWFIAKFKEEAN